MANLYLDYFDSVKYCDDQLGKRLYAETRLRDANKSRRVADKKTRNRREQLRLYQEKLELMRTWRGIFRTIGQKLGVCR